MHHSICAKMHGTCANNYTNIIELNEINKYSINQRTQRKNCNTNSPKKISQLLHNKEQLNKNTYSIKSPKPRR